MLDWQEMAQELSGGAEIKEGGDAAEALESLSAEIERLTELLEETETNLLLSSEEDHADAILEIHPGAGGTEAQDWAQMLQRMYLRWADSHGFSVEELDFLPGDEAGIKSVSLRISGENVYGFLKGERGIHRLIRISPFDSSGRRHTSFASVDVIPDAGDDIDDLMMLCEADITSKNQVRKKQFLENFRIVREKIADLKERDYKRLLQPVIDGNEIMELFHLKPSREVGELKKALKEAVLENIVPNEREPLLALLREKAKELGVG